MMKLPENKYGPVDSLWQEFQRGNYEVLGGLFQHFYKELYFYGLKLAVIPDLVKDTIQDVFADVWSRRHKMVEINNIKAYLFISVRHELLKRLEKHRKTSSRADTASIGLFEFSQEDFIVKKESDQEASLVLFQSLMRLTERQREVILLRFSHEMEFHEIAMIMEMKVQSVRNLLFRALERIRSEMNRQGTEGSSDIETFLVVFLQNSKI